MKRKHFLGIILLLAVIFFWHFHYQIVEIKGKKFLAEISSSTEELQKGLGKRKKICRRCAMLFLFPKEDEYSFWMKDMEFNLDIIWIRDNKIVFLKKNVPFNFLGKIDPKIKADKVLELNAGLSEEFGFKEGDEVFFH